MSLITITQGMGSGGSEIARRVWAASGVDVPNDEVSALIDPRFVLEAGARTGQTQFDPEPL